MYINNNYLLLSGPEKITITKKFLKYPLTVEYCIASYRGELYVYWNIDNLISGEIIPLITIYNFFNDKIELYLNIFFDELYNIVMNNELSLISIDSILDIRELKEIFI